MRIQEPPLSGTIEPLKGVALVQQRNAAPLAVRPHPALRCTRGVAPAGFLNKDERVALV